MTKRLSAFLFGFQCMLIASYATAGDYGDYWAKQSNAVAACTSRKAQEAAIGKSNYGGTEPCGVVGDPSVATGGSNCPSGLAANAHLRLFIATDGEWDYFWCVSATCSGAMYGGRQGWRKTNDPAAPTADDSGCCVSWVGAADPNGNTSFSYGGVSMEFGSYQRNGSRCGGVAPPESVAKVAPPDVCKAGAASCFDPQHNRFCGSTESGEFVCAPRDPGPPGGCISGATGSMCVNKAGDPIPNPSDPPIPPGTQPTNTSTSSVTNNSVTNNYTTNVYSGTSDGGSGPEAGTPNSSSSPGGNNTNQNGNGNNNSGGKGTDSNGKCSDGSVPTASGCSGTYRDNGCDTPPACFGDAVLCGIAANTHKAACNGPASGSSIGGVPNEGDPMDGSGDPHSSGPSEVDLGDGSNLDSTGFGFTNACPIKDVTFSVMGKTVTIPLQDKCDLLAFLRYVVLGLAVFASAKIIAGVA